MLQLYFNIPFTTGARLINVFVHEGDTWAQVQTKIYHKTGIPPSCLRISGPSGYLRGQRWQKIRYGRMDTVPSETGMFFHAHPRNGQLGRKSPSPVSIFLA
jgi:hypothetical protein